MKELIGILFSPEATWSALAQESDSKIKSRLLLILLMAAIPPLGFYYGTTQVGWHSGGELTKISAASAIPLMVLFYLALVASV